MSLNLKKCKHPGCKQKATGGEINGVPFCIRHITWAMGTAFYPVADIAELVRKAGGRPL